MLVFLIVLAVIALLLLLPVSAVVYYQDGLFVKLKILFINIKLYPRPEKNKKKRKKHLKKVNNKEKDKKSEPEKSEKGGKKDGGILKLAGGISELVQIAKSVALRAVAAFTIYKFYVDITVASDDPFDTAMQYGAVNAAVYNAYAFLDGIMKVKGADISINADYDSQIYKAEIDIWAKTCLIRLIWGLLLVVKDVIILKKGDVI